MVLQKMHVANCFSCRQAENCEEHPQYLIKGHHEATV